MIEGGAGVLEINQQLRKGCLLGVRHIESQRQRIELEIRGDRSEVSARESSAGNGMGERHPGRTADRGDAVLHGCMGKGGGRD